MGNDPWFVAHPRLTVVIALLVMAGYALLYTFVLPEWLQFTF